MTTSCRARAWSAMALAERNSLPELLAGKVAFTDTVVPSAEANLAGNLAAILAGDGHRCGLLRRPERHPCLWDVPTVRPGVGTDHAGPVPTSSPMATACRPPQSRGYTWSTALGQPDCYPASAPVLAYADIDSLLCLVFRHAKQGANFGRIKITGMRVLRQGPVPAGHADLRRSRAHRWLPARPEPQVGRMGELYAIPMGPNLPSGTGTSTL